MRKVTLALVALAFAGLTGIGLAQGNEPLIVANEQGVGSLTFPGAPSFSLPGILAADPGPGGLPSALTYNLLGPPGLVPGDLFIKELIGPTLLLSDLIRFNPAGIVPGYEASFVFYSSFAAGGSLAHTGFPASSYTNSFTILEVDEQVFYTPNPDQPGYVPGFSVTYNFLSGDGQGTGVPEPAFAWVVMIALAVLAARFWHQSLGPAFDTHAPFLYSRYCAKPNKDRSSKDVTPIDAARRRLDSDRDDPDGPGSATGSRIPDLRGEYPRAHSIHVVSRRAVREE